MMEWPSKQFSFMRLANADKHLYINIFFKPVPAAFEASDLTKSSSQFAFKRISEGTQNYQSLNIFATGSLRNSKKPIEQ